MQDNIPKLSRSNLHRGLQRHGLSRLPKEAWKAAPRKTSKHYPIGFVHVDITEVRVGKTKYDLFVGASAYAHTELDGQLVFHCPDVVDQGKSQYPDLFRFCSPFPKQDNPRINAYSKQTGAISSAVSKPNICA